MDQDTTLDETGPGEPDGPQTEPHRELSPPSQEPDALAEDETLAEDDLPDEVAPQVFPFEGVELATDREIVNAVHRLGETLSDRLEQIESLLKREIRAEAAREKVIDRLHAELQEYKQDLLLSTLRPIFIDLIQLHDDIGKMAVLPPESDGGPDAEARRLVGLMDGFQQGIEDILYRQGVEPFLVEGDTFDPRRQRAIATVATDDPALTKTVAARHRKGFQAGDRVIRPEIVSVFSIKK